MDGATDVLDFWFGAPGDPARGHPREAWFRKSAAFDGSIRERFAAWIERALRGELESWGAEPESALAEVLLLDQFTRNVFRDSPRAFAGDARALAAAGAMVGRRLDVRLPGSMRGFVYLPFEHAESMASQDEAVRLFTALAGEGVEGAPQMLDYAHRHRSVIERFGRFPHRNAVLGRRSTAEEEAYLRQPGAGF